MQKLTIGRDERNDIRVTGSDAISRFHAILMVDGNSLVYTDQSSNGSWINGQRVWHTSVRIAWGTPVYLPGQVLLPWNEVQRKLQPGAGTRMGGYASAPPSMPPASPSMPSGQGGYAHPGMQQPADSSWNPSGTPDLSKWNWGAFLLWPFWGLGNGCWWTILLWLFFPLLTLMIVVVFPPISVLSGLFSLGVSIYFGATGSKLAWKSKQWRSAEHFQQVQSAWTKAGVIVFVASIVLLVLLVVFAFSLIASAFSAFV